MELINKVRQSIKHFSLLSKKDRVLVCVSGGPDSIFLLHSMRYLSKELGVKLFTAHLDHGLRPSQSKREKKFVDHVSSSLGIKNFSKSVKIKKTKGLSVEEASRKIRYVFFKKTAKKNRLNKIATGHTSDDNAESVLMRVLKGSSIKGLGGIPVSRQDGNVTYVRPLLTIEKKEILNYLKKHGHAFAVDKTNFQDIYFRNCVRNKIIPYLSRFNPQLKRSLSNLGLTIAVDSNYIQRQKQHYGRLFKKRKPGLVADVKKMKKIDESILKEVLRDAIGSEGGNLKKLNFRHWLEIKTLIFTRDNSKTLCLPGKIGVVKKGNIITIGKFKFAKT